MNNSEILVLESEYVDLKTFKFWYRYDIATKDGTHFFCPVSGVSREKARKMATPALKEEMIERNIKPEDLVSFVIPEGVKSEMIKI